MKRSRAKPSSPTPVHQNLADHNMRLDSARLATLIARYESTLRQRDELTGLKRSYEESHDRVIANPETFDSIEQWNHHKAHSTELSNLAGQTLTDLRARIHELERRASLTLQAMLSEGLPNNVWVGIGAGEYVLLEHCSGEPVLRRAPLDAIRRTPEGTPPRIVEKHATQIIRSRYTTAVELSFVVAKAASLLLGLWAVLALFVDLSAGQSSIHVPLLAVASLALYAAAAFKSDLTPPGLGEVLSQDSLSEEPPGNDSHADRDDSEQHDPTRQQDAEASDGAKGNRPGMRWS